MPGAGSKPRGLALDARGERQRLRDFGRRFEDHRLHSRRDCTSLPASACTAASEATSAETSTVASESATSSAATATPTTSAESTATPPAAAHIRRDHWSDPPGVAAPAAPARRATSASHHRVDDNDHEEDQEECAQAAERAILRLIAITLRIGGGTPLRVTPASCAITSATRRVINRTAAL